MDQVIERLLDLVQREWHRRRGLVLAAVVLALAWVIAFAGIDLDEISGPEWSGLVVVLVALVVLWAWTTRLARHPKGQIGISVALAFEEPTHQRQVASDFVARLRELLNDPTRQVRCSVIEFPSSVAERIDSYEHAKVFAQTSRSALLLYGRVRKRVLAGSPQHVLDLRGLVLHAPIRNEISRLFSEEFTELLPRQFRIMEEGDLFGFEFTADLIDVVARYIVGTAALLSNDLDMAERIFADLETRVAALGNNPLPAAGKLRQRLPTRIGDVYKTRLGRAYRHYMLRRDEDLLPELEEHARRALEYDPNYPGGHLVRAICAFMLRRDIDEAISNLDNCRGLPDPTWRYSLAFLYAYRGDLPLSSRTYKAAFARDLSDATVPVQSEEFIQLVLDKEPDKVQLHFCLGLLNLKGKEDEAAARRDFEQFLARTNDGDWPRQRALAQRWIQKIDRRVRRRMSLSEDGPGPPAA